MRTVYLDHAATTPLDPRVREVMLPYLDTEFGNPSALYAVGRRAKDAIDVARKTVAGLLGSSMDEITFVAGGTESDNLAIQGIARAYSSKGRHLITSTIEHHAVLTTFQALAKQGWQAAYVAVDEYGRVNPGDIVRALTPETTLVSIMYANNEIGTIEPIKEITKAVRDWKKENSRSPFEPPFVHTDACQAAGALEIDVRKLNVDLMTLNGSKIYGPKQIGILYHRRGIKLEPLVYGGGQESRLRSGTENVAGIVGFVKALELAVSERDVESARLTTMRDALISGIIERVPKVILNGHPTERLPNNANVTILDVEGEAMLLYLDAKGISAATGSACDSVSLDPSHVIVALGRPYEHAHGSIRFTLGRSTTPEDVAYVLDVLPELVVKLRSISPVRLAYDSKKVVGSQADRQLAGAFVDLGRPHWEKKTP